MNKVSCDIKNKRWDYNDIINYALNKFKIDGIQFTIYEENKTVDRFSTDEFELEAIMICYIKGMYTMFVRIGHMDPVILCHELIHLWQYQRGDLEMLDGGKKYKWKGEIFDCHTDYNSRPWEKEAFATQNKLFKDYKKYKKSMSKTK